MNIHITFDEDRWDWLRHRGARTERDVLRDKDGEYVIMYDGETKVDYKVYLPEKFQKIIQKVNI